MAAMETGLPPGLYGDLYGGSDRTIFKITTNGKLTVLYTYNSTTGTGPDATMIRGQDGAFYGTKRIDIIDLNSTIFRFTPEGQMTILYRFTGGSDGADPMGGLVQRSDGAFYGTTSQGGNGGGTIFLLTP